MPWIKIIYNTEIIINGKGKAMPNNFDFGSMVFNEAVMRERLAEDTYAALKDTIKRGAPLARHIATPVAAAMKEWAKIGRAHV